MGMQRMLQEFITILVQCTLALSYYSTFKVQTFGNGRLNRDVALKISNSNTPPHVAVIGAGWSGWGACKTLCETGYKVTLLDVIEDPGKSPLLTPNGLPFEPGTKGFWYDYPNIANLVKELNLKEQDIFTPFTNSSFYSPFGLEATAPVFSSSPLQLPSPFGQVLASSYLFERIPISDRASVVGLLFSIIDLFRDDATFEAYDRMTAHELFIRMGVSKRLVDDFLRPTLLVGLFKPPEELSAAVVMELLYYYALAHQSSFDVRWMKKRTIAENIFAPLSDWLTANHNFEVIGSGRVTGLHLDPIDNDGNKITKRRKVTKLTYEKNKVVSELTDLDGVILAVGAKGLKSILSGSPEVSSISSQLTKASSMGSIDVISSRIWLNKNITTRSPANVFSRFAELRGAGGTLFMLDEFQKDNFNELWSNDTVQYQEKGSVVGVDFYNAGGLFPIQDSDLIKLIKEKLLPIANKEFDEAEIIDYHLRRYPGAVTWFSPGSYNLRPSTKIKEIENLFCAGDWVIMGYRNSIANNGLGIPSDSNAMDFDENSLGKIEEHGAKGLCQERAYVSGLYAANCMIEYHQNDQNVLKTYKKANILPIRSDEPQVQIGIEINRKLMKLFNSIGFNSKWIR